MFIRNSAIAFAATLACAAGAHAATAASAPPVESKAMIASAPGKAVVARTKKIVAKVEAIDAAKREVTLKGPGGKVVTVTAGPEVKNFDKIKVGDSVAVGYIEALSLKLMKDGKELPASNTVTEGVRAADGTPPGGVVAASTRVVANVTAVDAATQTVTLKGPSNTVDLRVPDPKQFALIKVGDQIEAQYTQALAVSVEPAAAAASAPASK